MSTLVIVGAVAIYVLGVIGMARPIAWHVANEFGAPSGEDIALSIVSGLFAGLFWPVVLPLYVLWRFMPSALIAPPKAVRRREELKERERAVSEREREIQRLERDLEIRA